MKKGFTLTELLMALTIVGVLAVLTIPILMNNIHNRVFANQVKNMAATIEQLAQDELIAHRTRDLRDTDFGDPEKLLSDKHFSIAKSCTKYESLTKCWKTTATGKDKVTYKTLNKTSFTSGGMSQKTVVLKNGVMLDFSNGSASEQAFHGGTIVGYFYIDVNGNDKPNILGRDMLYFWITNKGHVVGDNYARSQSKTVEQSVSRCKSYGDYCYDALADNGWKMDY